MPNNQNSDLHKWLNTALLGVVLTLCGVIYARIDKTLDTVALQGNNHENRIVRIETKMGIENKPTSKLYIPDYLDAILPDNKFLITEE